MGLSYQSSVFVMWWNVLRNDIINIWKLIVISSFIVNLKNFKMSYIFLRSKGAFCDKICRSCSVLGISFINLFYICLMWFSCFLFIFVSIIWDPNFIQPFWYVKESVLLILTGKEVCTCSFVVTPKMSLWYLFYQM